jgi:hypothetical protein
MTNSLMESQIQAEQLRRRISLLEEENATLRDLANPAAGPIQLQAENILLGREAKMLGELVPHLTPYEGALPESLEAFEALPEPHRRQIAINQSEHVEKLRQVDQLLRQASERDRREAQRLAGLEGLSVRSTDEFMQLDEQQRRELSMQLTRSQRLALCGETPREQDEAYL